MNPSLVVNLLRSTRHSLLRSTRRSSLPSSALNKISLQPHPTFFYLSSLIQLFSFSLYIITMNPWFLHLSKVRKSLSEEQKKELGVAGIAKLAKKSYTKEPQKEETKSQTKSSKKKKKGTKSSKKKKKKAKSSKKKKKTKSSKKK